MTCNSAGYATTRYAFREVRLYLGRELFHHDPRLASLSMNPIREDAVLYGIDPAG